MKMKKSGRLFIVFSLIFLIFAFSAFNSYAVEGEEEYTQEESYSEDVQPETDYSEDTQPPETQATQPTETQSPQPTQTQATEYSEETTPTYEETETTETYAVLDNNLEDLPEADTSPNPTAISSKKAEKGDLTYGFFSWACVIVGVLTVIIVILSNKSHYYGGSGKQRYDEGNKLTGQKRLLNDDYYTNRKYNSFKDRDNYR